MIVYPFFHLYSSEECSQLVENELCFAIQQISIPLFDTCPLFKKRLLECVESLIHTQTQKTIDLIRQLIAMELNFINVHHPDFIGTNIEKVRVEATNDVRNVFSCYLLFVICYLLFVICYFLFLISYLNRVYWRRRQRRFLPTIFLLLKTGCMRL